MPAITRLRVEPDNGATYEIDITMRDVVQWETTFPGRALGQLNTIAGLSARDMYELAWTAAKRTGIPVPADFGEYKSQFEVGSAAWKVAPAPVDAEAPVDVPAPQGGLVAPEDVVTPGDASLDPTQVAASTAP
jgi:hypothetical protein